MSKPYTITHQICDTCNKDCIINTNNPLHNIVLPGYFMEERGGRRNNIVKFSVCKECEDRLRELIASHLDVKEVDYAGLQLKWLDEEGKDDD